MLHRTSLWKRILRRMRSPSGSRETAGGFFTFISLTSAAVTPSCFSHAACFSCVVFVDWHTIIGNPVISPRISPSL